MNFPKHEKEHPNPYPLVAPLPDDLQFGLSNVCNLTCVFCGEHRIGHPVKVRRFSAAMRRMMMGLIPHVREAAFHENSEFFLDRDFVPILELCSRHGVTLSLNTNASRLTAGQIDALEDYKAHLNIAISLDAARPATYAKLRGGRFEKVWDHAQTLVDIVRRKPAYRSRVWCPTHTTAAFIIMGENRSEAMEFLEMVDAAGFDRVSFYRLHDSGDWQCRRGEFAFDYQAQGSWNFKAEYNELVRDLETEARKRGILCWLPEPYPLVEGKADDGPTEIHASHHPEAVPVLGKEPICLKPWTGRSVILASGALYPCCHAWGPEAELGNVSDGDFNAAWNSAKAQALRKALWEHRFPRMCRNGSCPVYRSWLLRKGG
ncbi:hypothetical protein DSCA_06610 [Desulfosarcina alkanivorans]|uniref:Radical SAM core domain-containing protein n=1 Tax=Desulfosarcina alkanivorans TaxID=571177 RepID=A0A5K7YJ07_9BACT|nr:radical SAM/SPASM domain-containing protein [Desulfosarcina alkanivorans]BBO66731.1 hypothetical protein DSCA_06610 [Desulfosarcina alkanivorans]